MRISDWSSDVCSSDLPPQPTTVSGRSSELDPHAAKLAVSVAMPRKRAQAFMRLLSGAGRRGLGRERQNNDRCTNRSESAVRAQPLACRTSGSQASRSEEHTSELQSLMRISSAVFCLKKKKSKCN